MSANEFDRAYFETDDQKRGYTGEGYRDFACHHATAFEVLARNPDKRRGVLELGAARGYVSKYIHNAGVRVVPMDISAHCYHTRATKEFILWDLTRTPWRDDWKQCVIEDKEFDLIFSNATFEHIQEKDVGPIFKEMERTSDRALIGITFTKTPNDIDKTHLLIKPKEWWEKKAKKMVPGYEIEFVDKEDLEYHGDLNKIIEKIPRITLDEGRKQKKLNLGSHVGMFYFGWENSDVNASLLEFAKHQGYDFMPLDASKAMPFPDGYADFIFSSHLIEHFPRMQGAMFIQECFRILRPGGIIRIATPDSYKIMSYYVNGYGKKKLEEDESILQFRHVNVGVSKAMSELDRLAHLLLQGHQSIYDADTLIKSMRAAGFNTIKVTDPWSSMNAQLAAETIVSHPTVSVVVEAKK